MPTLHLPLSHRRSLMFLLAVLLTGFGWMRIVAGSSPVAATATPVQTHRLGALHPGSAYGVTVSVRHPARFNGEAAVGVAVSDADGTVIEKSLHAGDLDLYLTLAPRAAGPGSVVLSGAASLAADVDVTIEPIATAPERGPQSAAEPAVIAAQPNGTWQAAQSFRFGQTIFGSADERPYIPAPKEDAYQALLKGFQWFKFTFQGATPRLAYFVLDVTDRDVPFDVDLFQLKPDGSDVQPFTTGQFVYLPEATQNYPGMYKFRTRILQPGQTYYVRVYANHPAYQLHTYDYPLSPSRDAQTAVRTGMDFLINMGDSWHSNTPRRGTVALRSTMAHSETQLCIACHPTQFTTRGYLTAVAHGYPVRQRPSLEFITDRLYNNPRPLYGEPGTNWVRVIYSARTVASRLPLLLDAFERHVTHDAPRAGYDEGFANFLKIHYHGLTAMPGDEPDGCEPNISPYEIATQSWQTFDLLWKRSHALQWKSERDRVTALAIGYKPVNVIDLNWRITFLATADRVKYAPELRADIARLYSLERPNGTWSYLFDPASKSADFVSFHSIYALASAGERPETNPQLAKAVAYCLNAQRPEGDWQGDPVYKGFNTPFRDTQFAIMALSTLYPGPYAHGASAPVSSWATGWPAPPTRLAQHDLPRLLFQLDQFWDLAPEATLQQIRAVLAHSDQPLAREAAARALGHMADPGATPMLIRALGDRSKLVQRTAAWALREVLARRPQQATAGRAQLVRALQSPEARVRWGATRLFNQHFKYLTGDPALLHALEGTLNDPVPMVRFQAASGLWRWYYWQVDQPVERDGILRTLATRLNVEADPLVRRGLQESIYDLLDENTGYLAAWVKTATSKQDKNRIDDGYEAVVRGQARVLAAVLRTATLRGRLSVLNAMWDFHTRHMSLPTLKQDQVAVGLPRVLTTYVAGLPDLHRPGYEYPPYRETVNFRYAPENGFYQTRIGNDSDLIHFFSSTGPELEEALVQGLLGADRDTKIEVLKAGSTLSAAGTARFAAAALRLSLDPDPAVRHTVSYVYANGQRGILNLDQPRTPDPQLSRTMVRILASHDPEGQQVVLPLLYALAPGSPWSRDADLSAALQTLLQRQPRPANYAAVLRAASSFPVLVASRDFRSLVYAGLHDGNADVQHAAVEIALERLLPEVARDPRGETAQALTEAFARLSSATRGVLIEEVSNPVFLKRYQRTSGGARSQDNNYFGQDRTSYQDPHYLQQPVVRQAVVLGVRDPNPTVRSAALDLLRHAPGIEHDATFLAAVRTLRDESNPRLQAIASGVLAGKTLDEALHSAASQKLVDFDYFVTKVEPILATPGPDGKACVECHASHAIFRLRPPGPNGVFAEADSRENFRYAQHVIDIADPQHSLMLIKPTRPTDSAGNVADYLATHNGGQRWPGNESSWQYRTILDWVRGARLTTTR
ncbi:MAG: HEAT repeat domain-containing protein [Terriglobales bacterium]